MEIMVVYSMTLDLILFVYFFHTMIQTKTIAMLLLIAIATVGTIGIGTEIQPVHAQVSPCPQHCVEVDPHGPSELPNIGAGHDATGDLNSNGHA
jgi:hypothetical protein